MDTSNDELRKFVSECFEPNWQRAKLMLPPVVGEWVRILETQETLEMCGCTWIIHPDDVNKEEGKRRIRSGEAHPACPVHTKEGFILGFFRWVITGETSNKLRDAR